MDLMIGVKTLNFATLQGAKVAKLGRYREVVLP